MTYLQKKNDSVPSVHIRIVSVKPNNMGNRNQCLTSFILERKRIYFWYLCCDIKCLLSSVAQLRFNTSILLYFLCRACFPDNSESFVQCCLCCAFRPYIIVKNGKPAVKNKHIEELSQGYRCTSVGSIVGNTLIFWFFFFFFQKSCSVKRKHNHQSSEQPSPITSSFLSHSSQNMRIINVY